jgi:hypothetical protein
MRFSAPTPRARRRPRRVVAAALAVAALAVTGTAGSAGAQEPAAPACAGVTLDATVSAPSVPGGGWSAVDACVPLEAVYEATVLGYQLVGGLGVATYTDGHVGRVAFVTAKVAEDRALTLVGVEDQATGVVTWAYADGTFAQDGATRTVGGAANAATIPSGGAPGPVESAQVQLTIDGTGTDLATAQGPVADQIRGFLDQAAAALSSGS